MLIKNNVNNLSVKKLLETKSPSDALHILSQAIVIDIPWCEILHLDVEDVLTLKLALIANFIDESQKTNSQEE